MSALYLILHTLAAVLWIGGIFYSYMILRPVSAQLAPPERLKLWDSVFHRFFAWVWGFVGVLIASGYADLFTRFGGFSSPGYLHGMQLIGWVMIALYAWLYFIPFRRLRRSVAAERWSDAAQAMHPIRRIMGVNLTLGLLITAIGVAGPYLSL
ncbi:MAG: CopD family protein [Halothiobacillaceae bacterium]|nr:CopD family protein [Halothiobacillaceae bacterium]